MHQKLEIYSPLLEDWRLEPNARASGKKLGDLTGPDRVYTNRDELCALFLGHKVPDES